MTLAQSATFNVEASLNEWMRTGLGTIALPAWLPTVTVVTSWAEITASLPCVSLAHLPGYRGGKYSGRIETASRRALRAHGMFECSVWASRGNANWEAQLRFMQGMVEQVYDGQTTVRLKDWITNPAAPTNVGYRVVLGEANWVQVSPDPNPDVERRRMLINYQWYLRSS